MDTRFTGVIPPLITPFTQDGAVDLDGLDRVIEHLVAGGVNMPSPEMNSRMPSGVTFLPRVSSLRRS